MRFKEWFRIMEQGQEAGNPNGESNLNGVTNSVSKGLDKQGGKEPEVDKSELSKADFITLPKGVKGTNCSNCSFQKKGICQHPSLSGQPVNERNCCGYWTSQGTLRNWKS